MGDEIMTGQTPMLDIMRAMMSESDRLQEAIENNILNSRIQLDALEISLAAAKRANEDLKREMRRFGILPTDR